MPHTRSAKKRLRQNEKLRLHNRDIKKSIRATVKSYLKALQTGTVEEAQKELNLCNKKLDRASQKNIYHVNKVARRKSQLARLLKAKQQTIASSESEEADS